MRNIFIQLCLIFLCTACTGTEPAQGKSPQNRYASPIGNLSCNVAGLDTGANQVTDQFGPHGGTIKITDVLNYHRIDIERFNPTVVEQIKDETFRNLLYQQYYLTTTLVQIEAAYQQKTIPRQSKPMTINNYPVYYALVQIPQSKDLRSTIIYSNGLFVYTFTSIDVYRNLEWSQEKENQNAYALAQKLFKKCRVDAIGG